MYYKAVKEAERIETREVEDRKELRAVLVRMSAANICPVFTADSDTGKMTFRTKDLLGNPIIVTEEVGRLTPEEPEKNFPFGGPSGGKEQNDYELEF